MQIRFIDAHEGVVVLLLPLGHFAAISGVLWSFAAFCGVLRSFVVFCTVLWCSVAFCGLQDYRPKVPIS